MSLTRLNRFPFNLHDLLKFFAIILMITDHVGLYMNGGFWLRIIGRLSMPLFAILYGSHFKNPDKKLLYYGIFLTIFQMVIKQHHIYFNILVMFYLYSWCIKFHDSLSKNNKILFNIGMAAVNIYTSSFFEYGTLIYFFMLIAKNKKLYWYLLTFFYFYLEQVFFYINSIPMNIFAITTLLLESYYLYKQENKNLNFDNIFIRFVARYSLEVYVLQFIFFHSYKYL
ncbi:MAG: TraX family protein [Rickettsiales bacterium]|nr:MAG: TraX family protein [Rickettsiales bacterium]